MKDVLSPIARESLGVLVRTECIQKMRTPNSFTTHDTTTAIEDLVPYLNTEDLKDLQARIDCQVTVFKNSTSTPEWKDLLQVIDEEILQRHQPKHVACN